MISKQLLTKIYRFNCFRAVLFRMVSKHQSLRNNQVLRFRAVLFRMVSKQLVDEYIESNSFRAVLFRMVSKLVPSHELAGLVLELCCFEWFQNKRNC